MVSIKTTLSVPSIKLTLDLYDFDNLICSSTGKNEATISLINLFSSSDAGVKQKDKNIQTPSKVIKHKYILQGTLNLADFKNTTHQKPTPNKEARRNSKDEKTIGKKSKVVTEKEDSEGITWKTRIYSSDSASLVIVKDCEKEERLKVLKESWESVQLGRTTRVKECREKFLKVSDQTKPIIIGMLKNTKRLCKPWTLLNGSPKNNFENESTYIDLVDRLLTDKKEDIIFSPPTFIYGWSDLKKGPISLEESLIDRIKLDREETRKSFLKTYEQVKETKENDRDNRIVVKDIHNTLLSQILSELEAYKKIDNDKIMFIKDSILKKLDAESFEMKKNLEANLESDKTKKQNSKPKTEQSKVVEKGKKIKK